VMTQIPPVLFASLRAPSLDAVRVPCRLCGRVVVLPVPIAAERAVLEHLGFDFTIAGILWTHVQDCHARVVDRYFRARNRHLSRD
jgi:hypothetical protein